MKSTFFAILALVILGGCFYSSTKPTVSQASHSQLFLVSKEQMDAGAKDAYNKVLIAAKNKLNTNIKETKRVRDISSRLISQVGVFRSDARSWDWQVNVINESTINAWCMPGGKIIVYSGIIEKLNLNDNELAAIIGHEISHALREHSRENASIDLAKNAAITISGKLLGLDEASMNLANLATKYTITLPFSRSNESEADAMGAELMARAGFDPNSAITLWEKMSKLSSSSALQITSTHPSHFARINDLKNIVKKVEPLYLSSQK
ncbi:M48 family metallopeptidase [Campylobacter fetus]|uniref:M48 family metallopeptidase n=1 Tax=Campylobacter fetus TaxID=196 RepID=UPI000818A07E|nr:M48 family metallopeptidase [Campylobacter fetus]OCS01459.1 peptidase M48 [Campylobacter fetus subsp. testudinum]